MNENARIITEKFVKKPLSLVIIVHGMAEHSKRYLELANALNLKNINCVLYNHLNHGDENSDNLGFVLDLAYFEKAVLFLKELVIKYKKYFPSIPIYILGHSMGSFILQRFSELYGYLIDGAIFSGSNFIEKKDYCMRAVLKLIYKIKKRGYKSKFINNQSFKGFNKRTENNTNFDWLSDDPEAVQKYIDDPLCGFTFTTEFFISFLDLFSKINRDLLLIRRDLPMLFVSGNNDPVGKYGKGMIKMQRFLLKNNFSKVVFKLYENGRHELLNSKNKTHVTDEICKFVLNQFS